MLSKYVLFPISLVALLLSLTLGLDRFFHNPSSTFSLAKIYSSSAHDSAFDVPLLNEESQKQVEKILSQKFTYYSKGSQAYVFISADGDYVLKFFKQHKLEPTSWLAYLPWIDTDAKKEYLFRKKKAENTFQACKLSYELFQEQTGLIYIHLTPSPLSTKVTLSDKREKIHHVNLGKTSFLLQKKAELIYPRINTLMKERNENGAKQVIDNVLSLLDYLGAAGVVDNDPILRKNFGLIQDRALQIDTGKLKIDPVSKEQKLYKKSLRNITTSFRKWIALNHPTLTEHFEQRVEQLSEENAPLE